MTLRDWSKLSLWRRGFTCFSFPLLSAFTMNLSNQLIISNTIHTLICNIYLHVQYWTSCAKNRPLCATFPIHRSYNAEKQTTFCNVLYYFVSFHTLLYVLLNFFACFVMHLFGFPLVGQIKNLSSYLTLVRISISFVVC